MREKKNVYFRNTVQYVHYFYAIDIFPRCWRSFSGVVSKSQKYQDVIDWRLKSGIKLELM